jgi:DHA1 family tetracycline resistance protein-like MFS transporter
MPFIMLAVLIDMAAIGVIVPVLPTLVASFATNPADQAFWYGVVAAAFGLSNFVAAPVLGALSDRFGRRPVMLVGFMGLGVSFFGTAMTTSLLGLIIARTLGGAMQANVAIANAYVADISAPEERAKRFGLLGAMMGVGFIVGPVVGGLLGDVNLHLPFYLAGSLTLLNLLYGFFVLDT